MTVGSEVDARGALDGFLAEWARIVSGEQALERMSSVSRRHGVSNTSAFRGAKRLGLATRMTPTDGFLAEWRRIVSGEQAPESMAALARRHGLTKTHAHRVASAAGLAVGPVVTSRQVPDDVVEAERLKELVKRMTEALDDLAAVRDAADTDEVPISIPPQGERRDPEQVVEDRDRIYRYVLAHGRTATREICERFRVPSQFVRDETKAMTADGLLVRTGRGLFEAVPGKAVRPSLAGEVLAMARALPRLRLEDVKTDLTPTSVHRAAQQLVQDGRLVRAREGARVFYSLPKDHREDAATDA